MADNRENFQAALHQMRDAFVEIREVRDWDERERLTGEFFTGYKEAKRVFAVTLMIAEIGRSTN